MSFQGEQDAIPWQPHLKSPAQAVYQRLATDEGQAAFWAESAIEREGAIDFAFPNQARWRGRILEQVPPHRLALEYYGGSTAPFELAPDGAGGTDLALTDRGVAAEDRAEACAGWLSVLLALKASIDFNVDLRNHDGRRTWDASYAEN